MRINDQIRITPIRVIDHNQAQLGVISTHEALSMARELGLDLVEVSPMERPPVCRIMDYGKFKYERKKKQKVAAAGHTIQLKEIRLRPKTDSHDREIKVKHARDFLAEGHKVQFTMLFRGRERVHRDVATDVFNSISTQLGEHAKVERPPMMDGKRMTMIVIPAKATSTGGGSSPAPAPRPVAGAPTGGTPPRRMPPSGGADGGPPAPVARPAPAPSPAPSEA